MVKYNLKNEEKKRIQENKLKVPTNRDNSVERINLRRNIKSKIINDIVNSQETKLGKRLDLVIGNPGSGKNSAISEPLKKEYYSFILDSDNIKKMLPEYDEGLGSFVVHEESSEIVDELFELFISLGYNIVFPMVGKSYSSITTKVDIAKKNGYEVNLHYCELSLEKTKERIIQRYNATGRYVSLDYLINEVQDNPSNNYEIAKKEGLCDSYTKYDNDVPFGLKPFIVEQLNANLTDFVYESAAVYDELNINMTDEEIEEYVRNNIDRELREHGLEL